ncbi:MAG: 50S ribosomal protein L19 [Candidatus Saccharimonadales bacterium]
MQELLQKLEKSQHKGKIPVIKSGDTVRVHQKVREGGKERVQVFEGVVIRVRKTNALQASITVRRIASGVGVEKTFMMHSPNIGKVTIERRSKTRRNYLSYLRKRTGKSSRMREREFAELSVGSGEDIDAQIEKAVSGKAETLKPTKSEEQGPSSDNADAKKEKSTQANSEVEKVEQDLSKKAKVPNKQAKENETKDSKE